MTQEGSLERRLDRLESERELLSLAARYCHGADDADVESFLAVWEDGAVWDVGAHRFEGARAIEEAVRRQWSATETMLHATSNSVVAFEDGEFENGETLARGRHDVMSVALLRDGQRMLTTGRYDDVYVRTAVGWRIRERRARVTSTTHLDSPVDAADDRAAPDSADTQ